MGLGQKILLFTASIVVALVAVTLAWTTFQSNRLARTTIEEGLRDTREVWSSLQQDRYQKLRFGMRVLVTEPPFFALLETNDAPTIVDALQSRGRDLGSPLLIYTDWDGYVVARSDRPGGGEQDLSEEPVVIEALEGGEPETIWELEGQFLHAVALPVIGSEIIGTMVGGFPIDQGLAEQVRRLTRSDVAFLFDPDDGPTRVAVSSLGGGEQEDLTRWLETAALPEADGHTFDVPLPGGEQVAILMPLEALSGERVGSVLAMRSMAEETAAFRRFRNSMVLASLLVMTLGLIVGHMGVSRITDPVRRLVELVETARDGSYTGAVAVGTDDEIGKLARAFNGLLADLREKEQVIAFLKEAKSEVAGTDSTLALGSDRTAVAGGTATTGPAPMGSPVRLETGSVFAGRYRIVSVLGRGGMGVVYRAHDQKLDEDVALKLLRPEVIERDPSLLDRFKLELKLARRITHRNVLRTHDFDDADGVPYISMEFVEGVMLKDLVDSRGALPAGVGLRFAKQICQGLGAAHAQGVVHRDIKPQNMMIFPETGELKIMDFGIARVSEVKGGDGGLTSDGTVLGTPDYMPPEQAQGHPADFRSDIYSLGVVFFEMFTGRLPFVGDSAMAVILAHIREPPPSPTSLNPELPLSIERIVLRCIGKQPEGRYQTIEELRNDLGAASGRVDASVSAA